MQTVPTSNLHFRELFCAGHHDLSNKQHWWEERAGPGNGRYTLCPNGTTHGSWPVENRCEKLGLLQDNILERKGGGSTWAWSGGGEGGRGKREKKHEGRLVWPTVHGTQNHSKLEVCVMGRFTLFHAWDWEGPVSEWVLTAALASSFLFASFSACSSRFCSSSLHQIIHTLTTLLFQLTDAHNYWHFLL